MRTLKIAISILAACVVAAGAAMSGGLGGFSPMTVQITLALAGAVSIAGISVYQFTPATARILSAIAGVMSAIQLAHAGSVVPGPQPHPWLWVAFGFATVIVGNLGKSPIPHAPVQPST